MRTSRKRGRPYREAPHEQQHLFGEDDGKDVPSPEADRATLIRRLSLDLLGLPPSAEDVEAFVADRDPRAYENLVERLLRSPHYVRLKASPAGEVRECRGLRADGRCC